VDTPRELTVDVEVNVPFTAVISGVPAVVVVAPALVGVDTGLEVVVISVVVVVVAPALVVVVSGLEVVVTSVVVVPAVVAVDPVEQAIELGAEIATSGAAGKENEFVTLLPAGQNSAK
jgi:hypothetical protein